MKALVLESYNTFVYTDVPDPEVQPDEVLIRVKACGICGSDVHGMDGSTGRRKPPVIMGHEAAGVIVETGASVTEWKPDDRVTFDSTIWCGRCAFCREGRVNLCSRRRVLGVSCDEYRCDGAFAGYVAVPERVLYRLPDEVGFQQAAFCEPLSIALHAVGRSTILLDGSACVVGAGMIGLFVIQALRRAGCSTVIAVDVDPARLETAAQLGADLCLQPDAPYFTEQVAGAAGGEGVDVAFEVVGMETTLLLAESVVRKGGSLVLVGNLSAQVEFPLQRVVTREITVHGSCASAGEYPACLSLLRRGGIQIDPLLSAAAPLSDGAVWFERLHRRERGLLKVLLIP